MGDLLDLLSDLWAYMRARQKYWLAPLIITLVLMGLFMKLTEIHAKPFPMVNKQ